MVSKRTLVGAVLFVIGGAIVVGVGLLDSPIPTPAAAIGIIVLAIGTLLIGTDFGEDESPV
ncbi:hypothetical protein BRD17_00465 [Halobacteriales archaeon SW_7_68_16]|nr:MAG: hypothetical protein BRD17_00465 [Halobacteriales archaeon SW_7_68_16]